MSPNAVLRLDERSEIELVSDDITDVQVRLLSGSVIFDLAKGPEQHTVTLLCENARVRIMKRGIYRADAGAGTSGALRVFQGRIRVSLNGTEQEVGANQSIRLIAGLSAVKVGKYRADMFDTWNRDRARMIDKATRYGKKLARAERR